MLSYLRSLPRPKLLLWCYLIWYVVFVVRFFDPDPRLWLNSLGLSALIGTALYVSTAYAGSTRLVVDRWTVLRCFIMPFCVSSFAALIKGKGFLLVLAPEPGDNIVPAGLCVALVALVEGLKRQGAAPTPA